MLLPIEVYGRVKRAVTPTINAVSTVMLVLSMLLVLASQLVQQRTRRS
jgi:spermidine/putrescine transport system permease protein